jgi:hypothetical protein
MQIHFPKIGDRVRFAIWYTDAWRPLGWVRVGKDGSIYLGLLLGHPSIAKAVHLPGAKQIEVKYQDLEEVAGSEKFTSVVQGVWRDPSRRHRSAWETLELPR